MMNATDKNGTWRRMIAATLPATLLLLTLVGCLGEPEIDERWTLVEFLNASPGPSAVAGGQPLDVTVSGRITYRQIHTGFLVAEVRYSPNVPAASVTLDPFHHTEEIASSVDRVLANSVTAGRATRAVTGFDHLMQTFDLAFTAQVPDSLLGGGLYLLLYMGEGEEIELQDGTDSLVVTPFPSGAYEILHSGYSLGIAP